MEKTKNKISRTQKILIGFIITILIGAILLSLPISNNEGKNINFMNSLFISTSAVCVTGLTPVCIAEQLSIFGQVILMLLIQIGGLSFISLMVLILLAIKKKVKLSERVLIKESLGQNNLSGMVKLILNICKYTFILEAIGAILLSIVFIPDFGIKKGIFFGIFHSISAFCNAGFDILPGDTSILMYSNNVLLNITMMFLTILGGLGFTVWFDIMDNFKGSFKKKTSIKRIWQRLALHTKLVLIITTLLLVSGTIFIFAFEYNNKNVMGDKTIGEKVLMSAFYSTTLRTAGFSNMNLVEVTDATKFISMILMLIGGSPVSMAGGIKTITIGILIITTISYIKGKEQVSVFGKAISSDTIKKTIATIVLVLMLIFISTMILLITENAQIENMYSEKVSSLYTISLQDILFEVISAFDTVGLSLNVTPKLSLIGKCVIMLLMFIGRLGIITVSLAITKNNIKKDKNIHVLYPSENIFLG